MNIKAIVSFCVGAALLLPLASGSHPESSGECPARSDYVPADSESSTYPVYVALDEGFGWWPWSIWIYAESNGVTGLQRDDYYCHHVDADGEPYTPETSDTIIF